MRGRHFTSMLMIMVGLFTAASPVLANERDLDERLQKRAAEIHQIKDACWAKSEEHRSSPNTWVMNEGHWITEQCFRDHILELARPMFKDDAFFKSMFIDRLDASREAHKLFLETLYTAHDACLTRCGTIQTNIIAAQLARFQGTVFESVYVQNWLYIKKR